MEKLRPLINRFFPPAQPLVPGVYTFQSPSDAPQALRLHLRIQPDGSGVLIVNAATVIHLNPTAAEYAYHLVQGTPEERAVAAIAARYHVKRDQVQRDYTDLTQRLYALIETPDLDPVAFLDMERAEPYADSGVAPYRIDCALTYRLPEDSGELQYAPQERVSRELTREEWIDLLDRCWAAGIPHAVFTGGEPTLRPDLPDLITHAESLGMVTGLITAGWGLEPGGLFDDLFDDLLQAGLDHLLLAFDPDDQADWRILARLMAADLAVTVHLTLTPGMQANIEDVLDRLVEMDVTTLSLSAGSPDLADALQSARQFAADRQLRLVWGLPAPYSRFNPVALELAEQMETPEGAGRAWLYVEPDGDVLPGQGLYETVLGNLAQEEFAPIWERARAL